MLCLAFGLTAMPAAAQVAPTLGNDSDATSGDSDAATDEADDKADALSLVDALLADEEEEAVPSAAAGSLPLAFDGTRTFVVRPDSQGIVSARVLAINPATRATVPLSAVSSRIVDDQGREVAVGVSDVLGDLALVNLPNGNYGLIGRSDETFVAVGFAIDGGTDDFVGEAVTSRFEPVGVATADIPAVMAALNDRSGQFGEAPVSVVRVRTGAPVTSVVGHAVYLGGNGTLSGQVAGLADQTGFARAPGRTDLTLIQAGEVAHETVSTAAGEFSFDDVEPGAYSLVAVADGGFAAFSVNVQPAARLSSTFRHADGTFFVQAGGAPGLQIVLAPPAAFPAVNSDQPLAGGPGGPPVAPLGPPLPPGFGAPGGGLGGAGGGLGGGAGGGFGGGLGTLLGAAGLAAGVAALVDDDDDDNRVISPVVP